MTQVFVDLDGTLADFDRHHETVFGVRADKALDNVNWSEVRKIKDFYLNIPPMADMPELWSFVHRLTPKPIVLTGVPKAVPEAPSNKCAWVVKNLGRDVEVRCCLSMEKYLHAAPGDVLIDDWDKYRSRWLRRGGRWITHVSAARTIDHLLEMGIGL